MTIKIDLEPSPQPDYNSAWRAFQVVALLFGALLVWLLPALIVELLGVLACLGFARLLYGGDHSKSPKWAVARSLSKQIPNLDEDRAIAVAPCSIGALSATAGAVGGWFAVGLTRVTCSVEQRALDRRRRIHRR